MRGKKTTFAPSEYLGGDFLNFMDGATSSRI